MNDFTLAIKCHWCGNLGSSLWEQTPDGPQTITVDGFYDRISKKQPFDIERVCNSCGRTQPL